VSSGEGSATKPQRKAQAAVDESPATERSGLEPPRSRIDTRALLATPKRRLLSAAEDAAAFGLPAFWKAPPWLVVAFTAAGAVLVDVL
jgi:hypothetical protein